MTFLIWLGSHFSCPLSLFLCVWVCVNHTSRGSSSTNDKGFLSDASVVLKPLEYNRRHLIFSFRSVFSQGDNRTPHSLLVCFKCRSWFDFWMLFSILAVHFLFSRTLTDLFADKLILSMADQWSSKKGKDKEKNPQCGWQQQSGLEGQQGKPQGKKTQLQQPQQHRLPMHHGQALLLQVSSMIFLPAYTQRQKSIYCGCWVDHKKQIHPPPFRHRPSRPPFALHFSSPNSSLRCRESAAADAVNTKVWLNCRFSIKSWNRHLCSFFRWPIKKIIWLVFVLLSWSIGVAIDSIITPSSTPPPPSSPSSTVGNRLDLF